MRIDSKACVANYTKNLQENKQQMAKSAEKLSSGLRINRASDDPAGLVISEKMRSQIASLEQDQKNLDYSYNQKDTAEKSLGGMQDSLTRMREIALSAANEGGNSEETQKAYQNALNEEKENYNRTKDTATEGKQKLLDGSSGSAADVQSLPEIDVSTPEKAQQAVEQIDKSIEEVASTRADIGSSQKNDIEAQRNNISVALSNFKRSSY
jgi:flagellin